MSIVHLLDQVIKWVLIKNKDLSNLLCVCFSDYDQVVQAILKTIPKRRMSLGKLFKIVLNF